MLNQTAVKGRLCATFKIYFYLLNVALYMAEEQQSKKVKVELNPTSNTSKDSMKPVFYFDSSKFGQIVKTSAFADITVLINSIF